MSKYCKGKSLNYNFKKQKDPEKPMGQGDFANMPPEPKFMKFKGGPEYRGGVVNSYVCDVEEVSDIAENKRQQ